MTAENTPLRVGVLGYLAVLERLTLPVARTQVGAGHTGQRLPSTLTADAPLVALALASLAEQQQQAAQAESPPWSVDACLNHPGHSTDALASIQLLNARLNTVHLGPETGSPLEWQLLHADGEITWFSDPSCAVASLRQLPAMQAHLPHWQHLYLDGYAWLLPALAPHLPLKADQVWLNLGVIAFDDLAQTVDHWRQNVQGQLNVQISTAGQVDLMLAQAWADQALEAGADLAIVTCGAHGLVLANATETVAQAALPVPHWADASGAGAAVSSALIAASVQQRGHPSTMSMTAAPTLAALALLAAKAGQLQCMQDGALDVLSQAQWQQHKEHLSH